MKNVKNIILVIMVVMASLTCKAQLPLKYGDGVITHSPNSASASNFTTSPAVVRVLHTSNTSSAIFGTTNNTWNNIPTGTKMLNDYYNNWNVNTLGHVFGITLDDNPKPNIYVSSTQLYSNSPINNRKVWRLDGGSGVAGNNTLVYDYNSTSGSSAKSLGNLKYAKFGATENIYVSDFETGVIHRLTGNSTGTALWNPQPDFNPLFGRTINNVTEMPYGLAIRRISATSVKLYYSKVSTNSNSNTRGGYGNNEIYSVDINPLNGDFIPGTESTTSVIPSINRDPSFWMGYGFPSPPTGPWSSCVILPVIADIAFTEDGNKMLVGQQSWGNFAVLAPHNSEVKEFVINGAGIWQPSTNIFLAGTRQNGTDCSGTTNPNPGFPNAVGGVSYSNNVLLGDNLTFDCDDSVYFTSDYIYTSPYLYGVQGMRSTGGNLTNSIWIDADDRLGIIDKTFLGDVEIYKNPQTCAPPCNCGTWQNIQKGIDAYYWVNSDPPTMPQTISWAQGTIPTDAIIPHYNCNGDCQATFTYVLTSEGGSSITLNANANGGVVLSNNARAINNLSCGNYVLIITPKCGNDNCLTVRIPIVIMCPPPCSTCSGEASVNIQGVQAVSAGSVAVNYTISNSIPVTEVRVSVEDFRVINVNGNENCLLCQNKPKTWGSIQSANLTGASSTTVLSSDVTIDNREVVFKNPPLFNLSGNLLSMNLALPTTTGLSCCTLKAEVCIKFTIRDINCCEREITRCFRLDLK